MDKNNEKSNSKFCLKHKLLSSDSKSHCDKTRTPQQKRGIETKKLIIDAALELFSQKGFHNTNSKEIAAKAGVATGCFYSYFNDKRAVFLEALTLYNQKFYGVLQAHLEKMPEYKNDKKEFIRALIKSLIDAHHIFSEFHNELIVMKYSDPDVRKIVEDKMIDSRQNTLTYIKYWQDEIKTQDIEAACVVIYESVHNIVDAITVKNCITLTDAEVESERLIEATTEMIYKYLFA